MIGPQRAMPASVAQINAQHKQVLQAMQFTQYKYELKQGDFRDIIPKTRDEEKYQCVFADPPDNIGLGYEEYADRRAEKEYIEFLDDLVTFSAAAAPIVWISFNAKWTFAMGRLFDDFLRRNKEWEGKACVQVFTFGQHNKNDLGNNHRPLWRLRHKDAPLYPYAIKVPSWRQRNGDKRAAAGGRVPGDVVEAQRENMRPLPVLSMHDIIRLFDKIQIKEPDDCWDWTAGMDKYGRGRFKLAGDTYFAPRLVWKVVYGTDPLNQLVCHSCDNPSCCNPAHLFLGTDADNHADRCSKGRGPRGTANGRCKLSEHDVMQIYLASSDESHESIGQRFGVSRTAVRLIREGQTWTHITQERLPGSVFDFPRVTGNSKQRCDWHPTQLHEDLVERCVLLSTTREQRVLDPFGGTGTTMRVCKKLDQPCTLIELDSTYCDKIAELQGLQVVGMTALLQPVRWGGEKIPTSKTAA